MANAVQTWNNKESMWDKRKERIVKKEVEIVSKGNDTTYQSDLIRPVPLVWINKLEWKVPPWSDKQLAS